MVTPGTASAVAAKAVTTKIPIVFNIAIDPVQSGLVASLSRPGGNIIGVSLMEAELAGKRLDLPHELLPTAAVPLSWSIRVIRLLRPKQRTWSALPYVESPQPIMDHGQGLSRLLS
jgi:hypothetical protein